MKRNYILFLIITLLMGNFFRSPRATAMSIETRFHYTEGDYGTGQKATFMSFPLEIQGQPCKGVSLGMTVPYVSTSQKYPDSNSEEANENVNLSLSRQRRGERQPKKSRTTGIGAGNDPYKGSPAPRGNFVEANGMGDIFLSFSLSPSSLFPSLAHDRLPPYVPSVDLSGGVKLPTANEEQGLGTGEYDYTLGIKLNWKMSFFEPYLYGDHTWIGDTAEEDFENVFSFGCGTSFPLFRRNTVFIELFGCEALYPEDDSSLSFQVGMERAMFSRSWIYGYGLAGLNEESPDFGFGVSAGISFH